MKNREELIRQLGQTDMIVRKLLLMKKPVTRENYLNQMFLHSETPDPLPPEYEEQLPEFLQLDTDNEI